MNYPLMPNYDIPAEGDYASRFSATPADLSSFLQSASQQLNTLAGQQKSQAQSEAAVTGMGRSGNLSKRLAGIDFTTNQMLEDLTRKVAIEKSREAEEKDAYDQAKKEQQDALDAQKNAAMTKGIAELGGTAAGMLIPGILATGAGTALTPTSGVATEPGTTPGVVSPPPIDWSNILKMGATGGELAGDIAGVQQGQAPTMSSLAMWGQDANKPKDFSFDDFATMMKKYKDLFGTGTLPYATAGGTP